MESLMKETYSVFYIKHEADTSTYATAVIDCKESELDSELERLEIDKSDIISLTKGLSSESFDYTGGA